MRKYHCYICKAIVRRSDGEFHLDWHVRLERAVLKIPDPPKVPKPL